MHIFNYPHYQSEVTQFIDQLKASRPELEDQQRQGRSLLWDKAVDRQAWEGFNAAQVDQQPYVYQTHAK
jgi:hypothetical protein